MYGLRRWAFLPKHLLSSVRFDLNKKAHALCFRVQSSYRYVQSISKNIHVSFASFGKKARGGGPDGLPQAVLDGDDDGGDRCGDGDDDEQQKRVQRRRGRGGAARCAGGVVDPDADESERIRRRRLFLLPLPRLFRRGRRWRWWRRRPDRPRRGLVRSRGRGHARRRHRPSLLQGGGRGEEFEGEREGEGFSLRAFRQVDKTHRHSVSRCCISSAVVVRHG